MPIEGLRAYLALWVVICHAFWESGYRPQALSGLSKLILSATYAIDLFIIISGFVIFFLLDTRRETYQQFIVRRFFRLFPVFIVLFVVAIPLSHLNLWNVSHAGKYLTSDQIAQQIDGIELAWENIPWHLLLHMTMLHGTVPDVLIQDAPGAFLVPAWSVSLEWQFYLVAPLAFVWAVSASPYRRLVLCALCVGLVLAARYALPPVNYGAALPFHVKFFFLGAVSYFIYQRAASHRLSDTAFPVACCLALFIFGLSERQWSLMPVLLWLVFMGLLLEQPSSFSTRLVGPLLTNPVVQYVGRISYSLYLSHFLVIMVAQYALLTWAPGLSRAVHFWVLLAGTTVMTIALSTVLHRYLEIPGLLVGRALAQRLGARRDEPVQDATRFPVKVPYPSRF